MDPITALGIATAVVTFVDVSAKIVKRLEELSQAGDLPKSFRDIRTRLPMIIGIISRNQDIHGNLELDVKEALVAVIESCFDQIKQLEDILGKLTIGTGDSKWRKGIKAAHSLVEESRVQKIAAALSDNVQLLMALNVSRAEKQAPVLSRMTTEVLPSYGKATGFFLLPFSRDPRFIGREKVMSEIRSMFEQQRRVAIAGIGGVGKSQIGIEFAYRFKEEAEKNVHVFWVYSGTIARFYQGFKRIAQKLELPSWDDPDVSILELVSEWFQSTSDPFLLILDNADNIVHYWPGKYKDPNTSLDQPDTNLAKYLPDEDSNGKVLVTTRDSRVATRLMKHGKPIVLQPMAMDEARELFLSQVENDELVVDEESIKALMRALDFLPLAISQAASFIEENALPISEYLQALHNDEAEEFLNEELNDSRRDEESINSVFRTWKISFDQIKRQKPRAAELLSLLACLDRQSIPKWLLKDMPELVTSISLLQAFAMVTARAGSHTYQLHRLVQKFVQLSLKRAGTLAKWEATALNCVSKIYPTEIGVEEWSICDSLAPHVQIVTKYTHTTKEARLDLAHLLCWAADFDIERGMYVQALNRARQSLELFRELVPFNDDRLAAATWLYGRLVYYEAKSEADLEQAAGILRESLEISSHATLNYAEAAFELAHIYYAQGKEIECLEMGKASFECWMAMEGERSVRTLDNRHDYALELAMFGDENEAIKNWQIILDLTPTSDASENTKSVYTYRSLASIAEFQGDAQLAEMLYTKLIKLCSTIYNPEHIHVFDYRLSHAEQILRQGRADEAMQLSMDMLEACKNKSEWRIALSCYEMMAECCKLNNDLDGEQANRLKCCELHTRFLGATHKDTIATVDAAAQVLSRNGKHDQAEAMHQHVLAWREVTLGADHAGTLFSEEHVAICKTNRGYDHEAESIFSKLYDKEHVDGARVLDNLCSTLWNQQKWDELELRCRRALTVDSDYRLGAHWMLVTSLEKQGKMAEALALRAESLEIEDVSHDPTEMRRQVVQPVVEAPLDRRFGRIIHPRTWSA